jgi:DNA-binding HxlR family transcriptional regulator
VNRRITLSRFGALVLIACGKDATAATVTTIDRSFAGKRTFNQLLDSDEGIATNVLRDRLNSLVDRGLLTKSDDPERKGRTRYALTERAITLVPVLVHLGHWVSADPDLPRMNRRLVTGGPGNARPGRNPRRAVSAGVRGVHSPRCRSASADTSRAIRSPASLSNR